MTAVSGSLESESESESGSAVRTAVTNSSERFSTDLTVVTEWFTFCGRVFNAGSFVLFTWGSNRCGAAVTEVGLRKKHY